MLGTLSKFTDDVKLGGVDDTDACAAVHRDLDRLKTWADRNLTFKKVQQANLLEGCLHSSIIISVLHCSHRCQLLVDCWYSALSSILPFTCGD